MLKTANNLKFIINRLRERLWVKPFAACLISIIGIYIAMATDHTALRWIVPEISVDSVETLLSLMASSMLVIAALAVTSMVGAYSSTSNTATPRSFSLVVVDDLSQNALSIFVGAFIFSILALTASKNDFFQETGRFTLFIMTISVFILVIITFVHWVDRIARLGRVSNTIDRVEAATVAAIIQRRDAPTLHGAPIRQSLDDAQPVLAPTVGYVQHVNIAMLEDIASEIHATITLAALPGSFVATRQPLAYISCKHSEINKEQITDAFVIGHKRLFDDDPRFGLVVLSEIAGRALSPAVNDPGTAIEIIGSLVRVFTHWSNPKASSETMPQYNHVEVPELLVEDMFDDAFTAIARDGAGIFEVSVRLQKAFCSLYSLDDEAIRAAVLHHSRMALALSEKSLGLPEELAAIHKLTNFSSTQD